MIKAGFTSFFIDLILKKVNSVNTM